MNVCQPIDDYSLFINYKLFLFMKKILSFLRENPLFVIVSLVSVLLCVLDNAEAGAEEELIAE